MTADSTQKKRSPCEKFMQITRNILKLSSFPPPTYVGSSSSQSPPYKHHPTVKQLKNQRQDSRHGDGLNQGVSSSFIKIQGIHHNDTVKVDDVNRYNSMETNGLEASITNLMVSDYIKRFHERNKHESVALLLPPPPPLPPGLHQGKFLLK